MRKEDGAIDWMLPAVDIWRRVRGYDPWPGAYTSLDGEVIKVWKARPLDFDAGEPPGTIVDAPDAAFGVQTGEGVLAVLEGQRPGRKRMSSEEILRGMPTLLGRRFETPAAE